MTQLLDTLEAYYGPQLGPQLPDWPTDPFLFLIWWHCGYPASDASCAKGFASLKKQIGLDPEQLLAASPASLALALKPGGMFPELRGARLQEIAERIEKEFGGDLLTALRQMPLPRARAVLKTFPGIANPGADRILLFAGVSPVAAVPSNCVDVLVRIRIGPETMDYARAYKETQQMIAAEVPEKLDARIRAYLLLKRHGQEICKRTNPKCAICPVSASCAFFLK